MPNDRRTGAVWSWVDFDDDNFGGYTTTDFDRLVRECRFLDIVEHPDLLAGENRWIMEPGLRPRSSAALAPCATEKPA
jgi:hypothetical protein